MSDFPHYNLVVIGGGIHGLSIAKEAAEQGYSVALFESGDIGASGSSALASVVGSNLRNLEQLNVADVVSTLNEQQKLISQAPYLFDKIQFELAQDYDIRSVKRVRVGLKIYNKIFGAKKSDFTPSKLTELLKTDSQSFYDYRVRDYRLTMAKAIQASKLGALIHLHCAVNRAERVDGLWWVNTRCSSSDVVAQVSADVLVNCTGHRASNVLKNIIGCQTSCPVHPKQAHYLVLNKHLPRNEGVALQAPDKQLLYMAPVTEQTSVLGPYSTSMDTSGDDAKAAMTAIYEKSFQQGLTENDILHFQTIVRAESEDPCANNSEKTVDVTLEVDNPSQGAPLVSVLGLSFLRHNLIAKQAMTLIKPHTSPHNQKYCPLDQGIPGGDINEGSLSVFKPYLRESYPFLPGEVCDRYAEHYGSMTHQILSGIHRIEDMGKHFGHGLYEAEVKYLLQEEWAITNEDILWRRTPLGIHFKQGEIDTLDAWLQNHGRI